MKNPQNLSGNKIGVILVLAHWILLALAIESLPTLADSQDSYTQWGMSLIIAIIVSDLPAAIPPAILFSPFYIFAENKTAFWLATLFVSIFTITFQWLFVGRIIYNTFSKNESKPISLSLNDK